MDVLKSKAEAFLFPGSGYGYGYGYEYSSGSGSGSGSGYGYGYGEGSGNGDGSGYGCGYVDGSVDGYGDGFGFSSGSGDGFGYGDGSGNGRGYGSVHGYGDGSGYGDGLKSISSQIVYMIDGTPTTITSIRGNVAKGFIVKGDLTLSKCFVTKSGGTFAHGETLHEAMESLRTKIFNDMPLDERIEAFVSSHRFGIDYDTADFFEWHSRLTGSCLMGRKEFAKAHGFKIDGTEKMTVSEFIELTENAYGGDVIRELKKHYGVY